MKNRRERRVEARKSGVAFEPQYNGPVIRKVFTTNNKYHFLNEEARA